MSSPELSAVALVGASALLALGATRACAALMRHAGLAERSAAAAVLVSAQIVVTQAALGAVGALRLWPVLGLNAAVSLALSLAVRPADPPRAGRSEDAPLGWAARFAAGLGVGVVALAVLDALRYAPTEYDSIGYHLPMAVAWLQSGKVEPVAGLHLLVRYYPSNASLLDLWLMLPLRGDAIVQVVQVAYLLLTGIALSVLAQHLGTKPRLAWLAGLLFLTTPQAIAQASSNKTDLVSLFFLVACLSLAAGYWRRGEGAGLYLSAAALGLFVGTRYSAVPYLPCVIVSMALCAAPHWRRQRASASATRIAVMGGLVLACGGFWYVRNWILTGNPLFPGSLARGGVGGLNIAGSWTAHSQGRLIEDLSLLARVWREYLGALGPGGLAALLVAPLCLVWLRPRGRGQWLVWWHTGWLPLGFLLMFLITPHSAENMPASVRYGFPALALSLVGLASVASRTPSWDRRARAVAVICVAAAVYLMGRRLAELLVVAGAAACLWPWLTAWVGRLWRETWLRRVAAVAGLAVAVLLVVLCSKYRDHTKFDQYAAATGVFGEKGMVFRWLASRQAAVVWWAGDDRTYPFYGPAYRNAVSPCPRDVASRPAPPNTYVVLSTYTKEYPRAGRLPACTDDLLRSGRFDVAYRTRDAVVLRVRGSPEHAPSRRQTGH